jgi:CheY-like chemotaxis protein
VLKPAPAKADDHTDDGPSVSRNLSGGGFVMRNTLSRQHPGDPYLLIVDDEPAVLDVTRAMASSLGWQPLLANTAEHALELFREHADAIGHVLVDLHMPGLDGLELAQALRAIRPHVHIAVMTGDEPATGASFGAPGLVDSVLVKPFALEDLGHGFDLHARAA